MNVAIVEIRLSLRRVVRGQVMRADWNGVLKVETGGRFEWLLALARGSARVRPEGLLSEDAA